jgi:hypothetical protein
VEPEQALYARLSADATLAALISTRLYPNEADADAGRPLVVYGVTGSEDRRGLDGTIYFKRRTVQVVAEADNFDTLKAVMVAVDASLDRQTFSGVTRCYRDDWNTGETDDGYEAVTSYTVWQ